MPLLITSDTVTPEGSEVLVGPKNHSNIGGGESDCVAITAEHSKVKVSPAVLMLGPVGKIDTSPISTEMEILHYQSLLMFTHMSYNMAA